MVAASFFIRASNLWDVLLGLGSLFLMAPVLWALCNCFLVVSDVGLWWRGGRLDWREVIGFVVHREGDFDLFQPFLAGVESSWGFHVGSAVTKTRSVTLYATARWRESRARALMDQLESERRARTGGTATSD